MHYARSVRIEPAMNLLVEVDYYWKNSSPLSHADQNNLNLRQ